MSEFLLSSDITFLNHGSFGATPRALMQKQRNLQDLMERQPVHFMERLLPDLLQESKSIVADFLGTASENLVFLANATTALNMILDNMTLMQGDEILATNHQYDAVKFTLQRIAKQTGASVRVIEIPFPIPPPEQIVDTVLTEIRPNTKALVIDHVTSPTAVRLPVEEIAKELKDSDVRVIVDGAHAPGQIDVALDREHFDYWAGNLHKWCCAPKGCAVLYVAPQHQETFQSSITSHGFQCGMQQEFSWLGTDDFTPYLIAGEAVRLHQQWGDATFRQRNFELMKEASSILLKDHPQFVASHPQSTLAMRSFAFGYPIERDLYHKCLNEAHIEVVIQRWGQRCLMRISCFSRYNTLEDYEYLSSTLCKFLKNNRRSGS